MQQKPKWAKKLINTHFKERVPCPYKCGKDFPSSLSLVRHCLKDHNWNKEWKEQE